MNVSYLVFMYLLSVVYTWMYVLYIYLYMYKKCYRMCNNKKKRGAINQ